MRCRAIALYSRLDVAKLNLMLSSDCSQIGTGSSNSPHFTYESRSPGSPPTHLPTLAPQAFGSASRRLNIYIGAARVSGDAGRKPRASPRRPAAALSRALALHRAERDKGKQSRASVFWRLQP